MNEVTFGSRLKELRRSRKLTQAGLGKILYVSHDTISIWERNKAEPSLDSLRRIATFFNITIDYLLSLETTEKDMSEAKILVLGNNENIAHKLLSRQIEMFMELAK